jgi:hypothetical protein
MSVEIVLRQMLADIAGLKALLQALLMEAAFKEGQDAIERIRHNAISLTKSQTTIYEGARIDTDARAEFTINDLVDRVDWDRIPRSEKPQGE